MADELTEGQAPEVETTAGQEPAPSGTEQADSETLAVSASKLTPQQALEALKAARAEAAARRQEAKRLRQEQQETTKKLEQTARQVEALQRLAIQSAVSAQAADFVDPLGAYARIQDRIEMDAATGLPTNLTQLLDELRQKQPDLLKPSHPRVGVGNRARGSNQPDEQQVVSDLLRKAGLTQSPESPLFDRSFASANGGGVYVSPFAFREDEGDE